MLTLTDSDFQNLYTYIKKNYGIDLSKKKQLIVKFNEEMSGMERMAYLRCIGQSLMTLASTEDAKEGGESGFGNLMDMMQLREWRKEDEETIRNGIPHDTDGRQQDKE